MRKPTWVDEYLNEVISYGGIPTPRGEVILHMKSLGASERMIGLWFAGHEAGERAGKKRHRPQNSA